MSRKKHQDKQPVSPPSPETDETPPQTDDEQGAGELENLRRERDDLMARLQRVSADYLNYQKRAHRDLTQAHDFANEELMKALLGVLDDMERALEAARENHSDDDPLLAGMKLVHDKTIQTLGRFGLEPIKAQGKPFDPEKHAAMMEIPCDEHPPGTVLEELQKGYELQGRAIRPTAVMVSKTSQPDDVDTAPDDRGTQPGEQPCPDAED